MRGKAAILIAIDLSTRAKSGSQGHKARAVVVLLSTMTVMFGDRCILECPVSFSLEKSEC